MAGLCAFHVLYSGGNLRCWRVPVTDRTMFMMHDGPNVWAMSLGFQKVSAYGRDDHAALPG